VPSHSGLTAFTAYARACVAAFALALVGFAAFGASGAAALPATFWGVDPQTIPEPEQYGRLQQGGVDSIRIPVPWAEVQPSKGALPDWSTMDAVVANASRAGMEVLPFVYAAPSWAVPSGTLNGVAVPRFLPVRTSAQQAAWKAFLVAAVERYGPSGTFWRQNPGVPMRPIRTWQIWNEENFEYFVSKPNPAEYGKLVRLSSEAIKGADSGAKIILGGMFAFPKGCHAKRPKSFCAPDFLEQMYAKTPGIKNKFDGVALHPYTGQYQQLTPYIEEFRDVLKRNHDAGKGLWITEVGWSSQPLDPGDIFAKGLSGQATQLKGAFRLFERMQVKWHLKRVYWFSIDDAAGNCNFCGGTGLFSAGFVPKPAWYAYVKFAGGTP
jgi:Glycosyl hydrolase catalytic core